MLKSYFNELIVYLSRTYNENQEVETNRLYPLAEVAAYIEQNFQEKFSLKELSYIAGFSERHFSRIFMNIYNTSPIDYIIKRRLKHACQLLNEMTFNITVVANKCGFEDTNYFTRQFKKCYGITPSQYKNSIK